MKVRVKRENARAVSMRLKIEVHRSSIVSALALSWLSEVDKRKSVLEISFIKILMVFYMIFFAYASSFAVNVRAVGFGNNIVALRSEQATVVGKVLLQQLFDRRISVVFE